MGAMHHPCLTPLPILTLSVSPRLRRSFTLCPIYKLRINRRSLQLTAILGRFIDFLKLILLIMLIDF